MEQTKKYEFSFDREVQLLTYAHKLSLQNNYNISDDVFNIEMDDNMDIVEVEKYYIITRLLLNLHFKLEFGIVALGSREKQKSLDRNGAYVEFNERFKDKIIEDILEVSFNSLYPLMIMNMEDEISDIPGINKLIEILYIEYKEFKNPLVKRYINSMYGMLTNTNPEAYIRSIKDIGIVISKSRYLMSTLKNEFEGHYICADTDTIYFCRYKEIEYRLDEHLRKCLLRYKNLSYNKDIYESGIFFRKKQRLLFKNGYKICKGFSNLDKTLKKVKGWN